MREAAASRVPTTSMKAVVGPERGGGTQVAALHPPDLAGHRQNLDRLVGAPDLLDQLEAVDIGHHDIGDDQIDLRPSHYLERGASIARGKHRMAGSFQGPSQRRGYAVLVFDQ